MSWSYRIATNKKKMAEIPVFIFTLVSKVKKACHLSAFVVSSDKVNGCWVVYFYTIQ